MSMEERAAIMDRMVDALVARQEDIIALIVAEVGCAQGITRMMQVMNPINHLRSTIKYARREEESERLPLDITPNIFAPDGPKNIGGTTVVREPFGVVSAITGYNFPFLLNENWPGVDGRLHDGFETFSIHPLFGFDVRRDCG
jgi:aldehyde dehydrogenase (NAD+)